MTRNATGSWSCARASAALAGACLVLAGCAAQGGTARPASVTGTEVSAIDAALTPVDDLNLKKDPIPPILQQARQDPYASHRTTTCSAIAQEMGMLNAVLGEDYDTARKPERDLSAEAVAQKVIAYLIPFRSVIREISGANRQEWEFRQAISAGLMRRAYLKGRGQEMGCIYPARPYPVAAPPSDPANFEDLGEPPQPQRDDPRRLANTLGG